MSTGAPGQFVVRGLAANITGVADSDAIFVGDLDNITAQIVQRVDNGTVVAAAQYSFDGTVWVTIGATAAETAFAAAADDAEERVFEGPNGMPKRAKFMRLSVTTHTGTGEYDLLVGGRRIEDIR